jgi:hypothetical protein
MFLIDDFLLWVVEQVHDAAQEEMAGEADAITEELRQRYLQLERGEISEADFDAHERRLLDRLDTIQARESDPPADDEDDELDETAEEDEQ